MVITFSIILWIFLDEMFDEPKLSKYPISSSYYPNKREMRSMVFHIFYCFRPLGFLSKIKKEPFVTLYRIENKLSSPDLF